MMYLFTPILAWLIAGTMKYCINYMRFGNGAKSLIGNGGFPSNHTTIVSSAAMLIGFEEGFNTPIFTLGIAITIIVIIDATGLRRHVGYHAQHINLLMHEANYKKLRERMGHTKFEVLGGLALGSVLAYLIHIVINGTFL